MGKAARQARRGAAAANNASTGFVAPGSVVSHDAAGLDPAPLIALRSTADQLRAARRRVEALEVERRERAETALAAGLAPAAVCRAAGISRARFYQLFGDQARETRTTRRGSPPAPEGGTGSAAPR